MIHNKKLYFGNIMDFLSNLIGVVEIIMSSGVEIDYVITYLTVFFFTTSTKHNTITHMGMVWLLINTNRLS